MRRLLAVAIGALLGGGVVFAAFQYHIVRTDDRFLLVGKQQATWHDAYVDIRGWTARDWNGHRELGRNLVAAGHSQVVTRSTTETFFKDLFGGLREKSLFTPDRSRRSVRD